MSWPRTLPNTESLDTVIAGYGWKPGDEAVMCEQDYSHMLAQFRLQAAYSTFATNTATPSIEASTTVPTPASAK
jgi:hypothetical protein